MIGTVLFIHGIGKIGGAERELLVIVDRLPRWGCRPLVVCPNRGPLVEEFARRGIDTRGVPMPPWRKLVAYPRRASAVRRLREVIEAERPVLLHVNDIWWVPQTLHAARGLEIPVVAHVRQEIEPSKARRYELDRLDLVLPVSQKIRQSLETGGVLPERMRVLYSGVDLSLVPGQDDGREVRRRFGIPAGALVLGTVANLFARKGYDVMLRALPAILKSSPHVHYLIIGGGDAGYETRLRALVRKLGLTSHVHFAGFQPSVYPHLAALDIYVHPALMEGFGIAVLEAMAMRKPVVTTAIGGLPEIVLDGETGVLVPPGDSDALARAVSLLLRDPARRGELGAAGRDRVTARFTVDAMMKGLAAGYRALLGDTIPVPHAVIG